MAKSLNIALQNLTLAAAAVGRGGAPADFTEMGLSDLLNVELRPWSYGDLGLQDLLNMRLDGSEIPGVGGMGFDPVRLASADLPDDLTQLSLLELMNIGVSQQAILQDGEAEPDEGDVTVSEPKAANGDHQSDSPGNPAQGGGTSFEAADLAALVEDLPPEDLPLLELKDEDLGQGGAPGNFGALVSSDEDAAAELIAALFDSEGDGDFADGLIADEDDGDDDGDGDDDDDGDGDGDGDGDDDDDDGDDDDGDGDDDDEDAGFLLMGTNGNDSLLGGDGDDALHGRGGDDVLDGGGGVDKMWGGNGDDLLRWDASDFLISGGNGTDTLQVLSDEIELEGKISGIERIDLASDTQANLLELTAQDVLDIADDDILTVLGDAADSVDAGAGWTDGGLDGEGYHVYTQAIGGQLATLRIDDDIAVNAGILA
jgi:hypothetical protein